MTLTALLIFSGALLIAAASPGPGIFALVARVISGGLTGVVPFAAGLITGDLIWLGAAVLGLAVLAHTFYEAFMVVKFVGAAYLIYLAYRMWTTPANAPDADTSPKRGKPLAMYFAGLAVTMGNPKVVGFYLALLPSLIDLGDVGLLGYVELAGLCVAILSLVLAFYIVAAARARMLFKSPRALCVLNRTGGTLMAGAAIAVVTK